MTDNNKAIVTTEKPDAPAEWGTRDEIDALATRIQTMMPGDLKRIQALALAQYSRAMDANPYRGETYAYEHNGKLILVDGYKLLVRWARRQCNFSDRYERLREDELPPLDKGAIGFRCYVLRDDSKAMLQTLIQAGAEWKEAFDIVASSAVGIVTTADRKTRQGGNKPPPSGWDWEQVARKRALKNALNIAYGAPSPREIAEESWRVEDTETSPEHWTAGPAASPEVAARTAQYNAKVEVIRERAVNGDAQEATDELFGEETPVEAEVVKAETETEEPEKEPEKKQASKPKKTNGRSWPSGIIKAVLEQGTADKPAHAVGMLNLSPLTEKDALDVILTWCQTYRNARNAGSEQAEAVSIADDTLPKEEPSGQTIQFGLDAIPT